jgi:hypothetical protein
VYASNSGDGYDKKMNAEKIADLLRDKSWK